ncbi:MAG: hypothetical protein LBD73_03140 [Deferribacteraceae bacterium]|nr:hypothetical protein [Deferribacteraceae bacterium]
MPPPPSLSLEEQEVKKSAVSANRKTIKVLWNKNRFIKETSVDFAHFMSFKYLRFSASAGAGETV